MNVELSIVELILEASIVVKGVMLILVVASLLSWALIFVKAGKLKRAWREAENFEERIWRGGAIAAIYENLAKTNRYGLSRIFYDGYHEFLRTSKMDPDKRLSVVDSVQRSMRIATSKELDGLEQNLAFLATVGSTSPYIGLFGTVWGIMNSFLSLGQMQQATLAVVAPGIAEALIATAIGLFAAIPAVMAYNRYSDQVERLAVRYENFADEFAALIERRNVSKRA